MTKRGEPLYLHHTSIFRVSVYTFEASVNKQTFVQFLNVHLTATIDVSLVGLMLCCAYLIPLVSGSFTHAAPLSVEVTRLGATWS